MKIYSKILSMCYFLGFTLHLADLFNLRFRFAEMTFTWKVWIVYLCFFDLAASIGLWRQKQWGAKLFIFVAVSQLIAYLCFQNIFGQQYFLVAFHILTLTIFGYLFFKRSQATALPLVVRHTKEEIL